MPAQRHRRDVFTVRVSSSVGSSVAVNRFDAVIQMSYPVAAAPSRNDR